MTRPTSYKMNLKRRIWLQRIEAIWSPPGNYLDQSPGRPGGEDLGSVSLGQTLTEEERQIKQERRKLRRRRSSSFVIIPSRLTTATFNLTNTIMGSGTLAMPYACLNSGLGLFPILVVMTAFGSHYAIVCLFKAVTQLNLSRPRYPTLGRATMGVWGEFISSWVVTLQQFGACIAFIIIIADVLFPVVSQIEGGVSAIMSPLDFAGCNRLWDYISIMPYTIHG